MVTHIDHLGRGRTLQIHVREVSKLKEKTEVGKEKKMSVIVLLCVLGYCAGQAVFELMILLLLGFGITDPCYHFLALGKMDLKTENDVTATLVAGGSNKQRQFTSLGK